MMQIPVPEGDLDLDDLVIWIWGRVTRLPAAQRISIHVTLRYDRLLRSVSEPSVTTRPRQDLLLFYSPGEET